MMVIFLRRRGISLSRTTVLKYMRELKLRSVVIPKKPRYRKGDCYKKFNNLLKQDFTAIRPNEKWCTDFTYFNLSDGAKRYNCSIIDLYDKSVLATLNSKRIDAELAIQTLQNFVRKKGFNRAWAKQDVLMIILRWKVFMEHLSRNLYDRIGLKQIKS